VARAAVGGGSRAITKATEESDPPGNRRGRHARSTTLGVAHPATAALPWPAPLVLGREIPPRRPVLEGRARQSEAVAGARPRPADLDRCSHHGGFLPPEMLLVPKHDRAGGSVHRQEYEANELESFADPVEVARRLGGGRRPVSLALTAFALSAAVALRSAGAGLPADCSAARPPLRAPAR
jgi:hypothetical protein